MECLPYRPPQQLWLSQMGLRQSRYTYLAYVKGWIYAAANIHDHVCSDVLVIKKSKNVYFNEYNLGEKAEKQFLPGCHWYRTCLGATVYFRRKNQQRFYWVTKSIYTQPA